MALAHQDKLTVLAELAVENSTGLTCNTLWIGRIDRYNNRPQRADRGEN